MATDGIRLPSDSTVASQRVTRGSGLPETQALTSGNGKATPQPSPLLTVVLQANPLIEGAKGALYELVLQNDPKDQPPIRLPANTYIQPGTSLLLEKDENGQYRPVDKPSQEQLAKLVLLELDYQRAHLLPKLDASADSSIFKQATSATLAQLYPELKPILNWLGQSATALNGETVSQIMQQFTPLANLRPWANLLSSIAAQNTPAAAQGQAKPANVGSLAPTNQTVSQVTNAITSLLISGPLTKATLESIQLAAQPSQASTVLSNVISDPRLPVKIGLSAPAVSPTSAANSAQTPNLTNALQSMATRLGLTANATVSSNTATASATNTPQSTSSKPTQPAVPTSTSTTVSTSLPAQGLGSLALPIGLQQTLSSRPELRNELANLLPNRAILSASNVALSPTQTTTISQPPSLTSQTSNPQQQSATQTTALSNTGTTVPTPSPSIGLQDNNAQPTAAPKPATSAIIGLQPPAVEGREPAAITGRNLPPMEITLGQWIEKIDALIQQSPGHMRKQLTAQAQQLIQQMAQQQINIINDTAGGKKQTSEEEPLLALRSWLEATQSRLQHVAVQTATQHWAAPDQPPVQQMQLPLIWLGLTAWADVEWWQENRREDDKQKSKKEAQRRWRMKIYLTLSPMSPMCADIEWSTDYTQLTFWSEDSATLGHLNSLLPTLESWTAGLGERALQTKHGMPKRVNEETEQPNKHLVDIRT